MRFLADMGIWMRTVQRLRHAGHDAVHLRDQGLNARLAEVVAHCSGELLQCAIVSVRDTDHRVRSLPIWPA